MGTMVVVSCRRNFWSAMEFSAANEIRRVDLISSDSAAVTQNAFLKDVRGKRLMVLVHGYNNEESEVISSFGTIDARMRQFGFLGRAAAAYDGLVGFAWPGGAVGVSFPFARDRARDSATRFAALLAQLTAAGATIDVNTHSLGAQVVLDALRDGTRRTVRNAWNFASSIDNESIEKGERYFQASQRCEKFYVFHSKKDPVLRVWYRVADFFDFDTALGYSGPEDPAAIMQHSTNVRVINCKDVVQSHGGYRSTGEVWSYMSQELANPSPAQFVTLTRAAESLTAAFRATSPGRERATRRKSTQRRKA